MDLSGDDLSIFVSELIDLDGGFSSTDFRMIVNSKNEGVPYDLETVNSFLYSLSPEYIQPYNQHGLENYDWRIHSQGFGEKEIIDELSHGEEESTDVEAVEDEQQDLRDGVEKEWREKDAEGENDFYVEKCVDIVKRLMRKDQEVYSEDDVPPGYPSDITELSVEVANNIPNIGRMNFSDDDLKGQVYRYMEE